MSTKEKDAERREWLAKGVDLALEHLKSSDYGEENDLRLLRELSQKIRKEKQ